MLSAGRKATHGQSFQQKPVVSLSNAENFAGYMTMQLAKKSSLIGTFASLADSLAAFIFELMQRTE